MHIDRNITASAAGGEGAKLHGLLFTADRQYGAFRAGKTTTDSFAGASTDGYYLDFNANTGDKNTNPMAGHANGSEIRPYSIYALPLISY